MYGDYYMGYAPVSNPMDTVGGIMIFALIAAIVLAILTVILITPEKRRASLNGFLRWVADVFNFKAILIEKILKFCYIVTTYLLVIGGLIVLVYSPFADYGSGQIALIGLSMIFLMPILTRIVYEAFMLTIVAVKNIISINGKLKNQNDKTDASPFDYESPIKGRDILNSFQNRVGGSAQPYAQPQNYAPNAAPAPEAAPAQAPEYRYCTECGTRYDANQGGCPNGCGR